jgi:hypothetical protein
MAIDDFWLNIRTAASFYAPTVTTDMPHLDAEELERMLRAAVMWLTPDAVDGFDPNDFKFLDEQRQAALRASVERFRAVASQVPVNRAATRAQAEAGRAAFADILQILQPHRFRDAESFQTQVLLERALQGKLPRWVTGLFCETGTDVGGDPAIWIWVEVTDDATTKGRVEKEGQAIHDQIDSAYRKIGGRRWPFIRFRSPDAFARREGGAA